MENELFTVRFKTFCAEIGKGELSHVIEFECYSAAFAFINSAYFQNFCRLEFFGSWSTEKFDEFVEKYNT